MNRRNKAVLIVVSALLVIGLLAGGLYLKSIGDYKAKVDALTFDEIDLTMVVDGVYEGQCDTGVVQARVQVTVRDHRMESIELLEHENGKVLRRKRFLVRWYRSRPRRWMPSAVQPAPVRLFGKRWRTPLRRAFWVEHGKFSAMEAVSF